MTRTAPLEPDASTTPAALYLDLLKRCLLNVVYGREEHVPYHPRKLIKQKVIDLIRSYGLDVVSLARPDESAFDEGIGRTPLHSHTMIGRKRLDNVQFCVESVIRRNVPGDLIETGVWRGGATILMRAILKAHGISDRKVWVADSFRGLPKPDADRYPQDRGDRHHMARELAVSLEQVKANFESYALLDEQVCFLKGWFKDTLPTAPIERLAVMRLDADMYESTIDALGALYHKLSPGGFVIVDDYGAVQACKEAVHDFRDRHGIGEEIVPIDWTGVYWQRSSDGV